MNSIGTGPVERRGNGDRRAADGPFVLWVGSQGFDIELLGFGIATLRDGQAAQLDELLGILDASAVNGLIGFAGVDFIVVVTTSGPGRTR